MMKMLPALRPELPRLSFAPFLVEDSSGDVTLAPRVPSTFEYEYLISVLENNILSFEN